MGVEVVAGLLAGSLALLSDAAHMLTDAAVDRPRARRRALRRAAGDGRVHLRLRPRGDPLGAGQRRGAVRARRRHRDRGRPAPRLAAGRRRRRSSSSSACVGALVNVAAFWALSRSERQSLNVAGARAHVLADLYGSVAAIAAGVVIVVRRPGAGRRDRRARRSRRSCCARAGRCCATRRACCSRPRRTASTPTRSGMTLASQQGRRRGPRPARLGGHVRLPGARRARRRRGRRRLPRRRRELQALLRERFGIRHTTLQVDHESWNELIEIEPPRATSLTMRRPRGAAVARPAPCAIERCPAGRHAASSSSSRATSLPASVAHAGPDGRARAHARRRAEGVVLRGLPRRARAARRRRPAARPAHPLRVLGPRREPARRAGARRGAVPRHGPRRARRRSSAPRWRSSPRRRARSSTATRTTR